MEKKITLKEFWESDETLAIHCNTEEKANTLLKAFDKMGKMWCYNERYTIDNQWRRYRDDTCYSNFRTFNDFGGYDMFYIKIYEFEDVDLGEYAEDKTMIDLFQEMKDFANDFFEKAKAMLGVKEEQKEEMEETPKEKTWEFTEKQKAFLKMLDKKWKYIIRDKGNDSVYIYQDRPIKESEDGYWIGEAFWSLPNDLFEGSSFDNIKWEDEAPCEFRKFIGEDDE